MKKLATVFVAALLMLPLSGQEGGGKVPTLTKTGDAIGTLPKKNEGRSTGYWERFQFPDKLSFAGRVPFPKQNSTPSQKKVKPGEEASNCDVYVKLGASKSRSAGALITPADASPDCDSTASSVSTKSGTVSEISGLETGDTVSLGNSNSAVISGTGGVIVVGQGCHVTVTNVGQPGPNGSNITCELPSGTTVTIRPGSSTTIVT